MKEVGREKTTKDMGEGCTLKKKKTNAGQESVYGSWERVKGEEGGGGAKLV